jgi:hypothetical protein
MERKQMLILLNAEVAVVAPDGVGLADKGG